MMKRDTGPAEASPRKTNGQRVQPSSVCYSLSVFTQKWEEIKQFYAEILKAKILSERPYRYCEMVMGGLPICLKPCDYGEEVSYFHFYFASKEREEILERLRSRGIIVTMDGPYANFRDPEGRVFKLSETEAIME